MKFKQEQHISNKKAFTLTEAIVSLTLIGIVAVIVIFKVVLNHDKEFESKFNKVSASIEANIQAYKLNHPGVTDSDFLRVDDAKYHTWFVDAVKTGLSFETCTNISDCWSSTTNFNDGENNVGISNAWDISKLKDETIIAIAPFSADNAEAPLRNIDIYIDINGKKGPNTYGKDIRKFNYLYKNDGANVGVAFVCPNNSDHVDGVDNWQWNNTKCKWGCSNSGDHSDGVDNWSWNGSTCNWIDTCSVARDVDGNCVVNGAGGVNNACADVNCSFGFPDEDNGCACPTKEQYCNVSGNYSVDIDPTNNSCQYYCDKSKISKSVSCNSLMIPNSDCTDCNYTDKESYFYTCKPFNDTLTFSYGNNGWCIATVADSNTTTRKNKCEAAGGQMIYTQKMTNMCQLLATVDCSAYCSLQGLKSHDNILETTDTNDCHCYTEVNSTK